MTDNGQRLLIEMAQEAGQVGKEILMLIATACARPFALAMAAQIDGDCMLDRQAARNHRRDKVIPTSPLIAHAVNKNKSLFLGVAPLPIVKLQTIMSEVMSPEL